jgi:hypothetical protein
MWFIELLAYFLIFVAIDYKRDEVSRISLFTKDWVIIMALVMTATILLKIAF